MQAATDKPTKKPSRWTRRAFLQRTGLGLLAGGVSLGGYAWLIEPHWVEVVRRDIPICLLPAALDGKTLVQISDLHIGPEVSDSYLRDTFRTVADIGPDILVVTGDFMTCQAGEELDHVCRVLDDLHPGRLATLGILGNHDYAKRYQDVKTADALTGRLTDRGFVMLRNRSHDVAGLTVTGVDDLWSPTWNAEAATQKLDPTKANLFLCHNPDAADSDVWNGYQGWILCGHTHGGQCKPPFLPPPIVPVSNRRYIAGEVDLFDGRKLYINRGLGHLRQVRFNVRPEITVFTLRTA
ncbi:MAG TPA: metallophosphoesterase [Gemmataceae bacterium]|nr:metallophosphoesterase [Gemmataceae bacterium]